MKTLNAETEWLDWDEAHRLHVHGGEKSYREKVYAARENRGEGVRLRVGNMKTNTKLKCGNSREGVENED